jgi:hypothetical protein
MRHGHDAFRAIQGLMGTTVLAVALAGCGGHPEISPRAYDLVTALYSICNREDAAGLARLESLLLASAEHGEVDDSEFDLLSQLVVQAREGEWTETAEAARGLLDDQAH